MKRYSDLKFKYKMTIVMSGILLTLILTITILFLSFFKSEYQEKSLDLAEGWSAICAKRVDQMWNPLEQEILNIITNDNFTKIVLNRGTNKSDELSTNIKLQPYLNRIKSSNDTVSSVYIITDRNELYKSYEDRPKADQPFFSYSYLKNSKGITILPVIESPFKSDKHMIPVIVPLKRYGKTQFLMISANENPESIIVILLEEEKIEELLKNTTTQFEFHMQLENGQGDLILTKKNIPWENSITIKTDTQIPQTKLIMNIDSTTFMPLQRIILKFASLMTLILLATGIIAIFFLSKKLTAPFQKITQMLNKIKDNTYHFETQPKYRDESGELIAGLNDMYKTILNNMETIRETENEKFQYLSQMLTEQINPHFIYNTLEMINMEIQRNNTRNASEMIQSFALYLRTTLNNGEDLTTIKEQTVNTDAYFKITNARLNGSIDFTITVPKELENVLIPKSIMQPIVENSIKHGFNYARNIDEFILPKICIKISGTTSKIIISIKDNGKGIDIENAKRIMLKDKKYNHMGLANIYKRLKIYDPDSNIEIFSVPYFNNEFKITFHPEKTLK